MDASDVAAVARFRGFAERLHLDRRFCPPDAPVTLWTTREIERDRFRSADGLVHRSVTMMAGSSRRAVTLTDALDASPHSGPERSLVSGRPPPKSSRQSFPISPLAKTPTYAVHGRHQTRARPLGLAHRFLTPLTVRRPSPPAPRSPSPGLASLSPRIRTSRLFNTPTAAAKCRSPTHGTGSNPTPRIFVHHPDRRVVFPIRRKRLRMRVPRMGTPLLSARRETRPARGSKPLRA